ncbi:ribonuclease H-like domain-containing protein, partial [Tanacetum coccineum]
NMAFVSSSNNNTSNSNEAVNVAHGVTSASTQVNTAYSTNIDNLSDAIICSFFDSQPKRKLTVNGNKTIDFDKSKVECYNCHKREHFAKECRAPRNQDKKNKESSRRSSDQAEEGPNYALMAYSSSSSDSEVSDNKEENVSQPKFMKKTVKPSIAKIDFVKPKQQEKTTRKTVKQAEKHRQNTHRPRGNQRNWNNMMSQRLGSNFEMFNKACYVCGSFDHLQVDCNYHQKQFQNKRMVKPVWNNAQRVNHQNFAKKTHPCVKKNIVPRAVLMKSGLVSVNTARQVNAAHTKTTVNVARPMPYFSKTTHSTVKRPIHKNTTFKNSNFNQRVNTVKDKNVNTVRPKAVVNAAEPKAVVNAARPKAVVNAVKGNNVNAVKASACWVWKPKNKVLDHVSKHNSASITLKKFDYGNPQIDLQDQGVINSRCSRYMTGNMSYLTDYEEIDGGYVAFGGNPKRGKITGRGTIKTGNLDFMLKAHDREHVLSYRL